MIGALRRRTEGLTQWQRRNNWTKSLEVQQEYELFCDAQFDVIKIPRKRRSGPIPHQISLLSCSSNGKYLAIGYKTGAILILNLRTDKIFGRASASGGLTTLHFHPERDDQFLTTSRFNAEVVSWRIHPKGTTTAVKWKRPREMIGFECYRISAAFVGADEVVIGIHTVLKIWSERTNESVTLASTLALLKLSHSGHSRSLWN